MTRDLPWIHELPVPDMERGLGQLAAHPHCLLLDSALQHPTLGRYSFLTTDPFDYWEAHRVKDDPLARLSASLASYRAETAPGLPPFQGGAAGLLGYELGRTLEQVPAAASDEFQCPLLAIGLYDVVLAVDHQQDRAWIISQGFPEQEISARRQRAEQRGRQMLSWLEGPTQSGWRERWPQENLSGNDLAPQHEVAGAGRLTSDLSGSQFQELVRRSVEYIAAGDIFQVNLSQRLLHPASDDSLALYLRLRRRNPATFAAYFDLGPFQILSASPERFVCVQDQRVETRPIKGTRRRMARPEADLFAAADLSSSEKDRAENVMIVDLLRNDLSRVCEIDSVRVTQLCELEQYEFVQHLVSVVQGNLADGQGPMDLVRAAFPGGSITGAPKVRAMEIIAELEPTARGAYCGSLGYVGFDGSLDLSILIRTITAGRGWWQLPAGGGIVSGSTPLSEYTETLDKARGMIRSLS